jgi:hypothetical protein
MKSLGNAAIGDESGDGKMRIYKPEAAEELLDLAIEAADANRRVIFFCSCGSPYDAKWCHRSQVADLVIRAAKQRKLAIEIQEWPGGVPARKDVQHLRVDTRELRKARNGAVNVQLTDAQASTDLAGLPWGGFVELEAAEKSLAQLIVRPQQPREDLRNRIFRPGTARRREVDERAEQVVHSVHLPPCQRAPPTLITLHRARHSPQAPWARRHAHHRLRTKPAGGRERTRGDTRNERHRPTAILKGFGF